ncbi:hypothetical protein LPB90_08965 [Chryseobacterium sp. LC2016-29]|uniref:hypothetical protein n=1 Tax=Chryseobacterium sp. LC2016-29 TaxID=2897331 RepID=UPI001E6424A7|nr:hypothetical protein [Chryseobacterium sp. LC2016-29]MCD0478587.1 hypothetical protein [Chryseobacterium sp. LC2016-29]
MKPIQLLLIIFCLGIFLIPKDNFYAQASQEICCKAESKKSCCEKSHDNHDSKNSKSDHKSCNDDCCSFCMTCNTFVENNLTKNSISEISSFKTISKIQVQYADPYISNGLKEIWQPPKLG